MPARSDTDRCQHGPMPRHQPGRLRARPRDSSSPRDARTTPTTSRGGTIVETTTAAIAPSPATTAAPPTTEPPTTTAAPPPTTAAPDLEPADWTVQPGWEQVAVLDAEPGTELELVATDDADPVATGVVDELGSLLFRNVAGGLYRDPQRDRDHRGRSRSPISMRSRRPRSTPSSACPLAASATSRPATARRCRSTSSCPGPPPTGRTRPSSSTPATRRAIPMPRASPSCSPPSGTPTSG